MGGVFLVSVIYGSLSLLASTDIFPPATLIMAAIAISDDGTTGAALTLDGYIYGWNVPGISECVYIGGPVRAGAGQPPPPPPSTPSRPSSQSKSLTPPPESSPPPTHTARAPTFSPTPSPTGTPTQVRERTIGGLRERASLFGWMLGAEAAYSHPPLMR